MIYLTVEDVITIHGKIIAASGGLDGIRDMGALESSIIQPQMVVFGEVLYPTLIQKAAILGFGLISNHPFMDGNKRIGHAAMEVFLIINGYEIIAELEEQEKVVLATASGKLTQEFFLDWVKNHTSPLK